MTVFSSLSKKSYTSNMITFLLERDKSFCFYVAYAWCRYVKMQHSQYLLIPRRPFSYNTTHTHTMTQSPCNTAVGEDDRQWGFTNIIHSSKIEFMVIIILNGGKLLMKLLWRPMATICCCKMWACQIICWLSKFPS